MAWSLNAEMRLLPLKVIAQARFALHDKTCSKVLDED